jgi:hypothetical protein
MREYLKVSATIRNSPRRHRDAFARPKANTGRITHTLSTRATENGLCLYQKSVAGGCRPNANNVFLNRLSSEKQKHDHF